MKSITNSRKTLDKQNKNYNLLLISNMNTHPTKAGIQSKKEYLYELHSTVGLCPNQ